MRRLACLLAGHREVRVRAVGLVARPGGILPPIDGFMAYEPHPEGEHVACERCRRMLAIADHGNGPGIEAGERIADRKEARDEPR